MSSSAKRLDLRFGAFACSVQGFDDPVPPVQQILRAIQHLLEESPELADTAINFDAEAIEQLVGEVARRSELDENEVEIVPGLIIIHHGAGSDLGAAYAPAARAADAEAEPSWAAEDAGGGDYVNIFAAPGESAEEETAADTVPGDGADAGSEEEDFTDRLRRMATGSDEYGWSEEEEQIRAPAHGAPDERARAGAAGRDIGEEELREEGDDEEEEPLNLFAGGAASRDEAVRESTVHNLFAAETGEDAWDADAAEDGSPGEDAAEMSAADLAGRADAKTVPELMIASAAWMVLTQGQTSFTRRDVLDVFDTIPGDHEKTPEARIKGFGKAVRNGQLVATGDGIFGLSRGELARFQNLL